MVWGSSRGIDDILEKLNQFTHLHLLRNRRFDEEDAKKLVDLLKNNTTICELAIPSHHIPPNISFLFADLVAVNRTLTSLSLGNTSFGDDSLAELCKGLAQNSNLLKLDLHAKGITSTGCQALAAALQNNSSLQELDVSSNPIGNTGLGLLASSLNNLKVLNINDCDLEGSEAGAILETMLQKSKIQLTSLHLAHNALGPDGYQNTALGISKIAQLLQNLNLSNTEMGEGIIFLATDYILKSKPSALRHLDLSSNGITDVHLRTLLSPAVISNLQLETLLLCDNKISELESTSLRGLAHIASSSLVLDIADNPLGTGISNLEDCGALVSVRFHNCSMSNAGCRLLTEKMQNGGFKNLQELDISSNGIDGSELLSLVRVAGRKCQNLKHLVMAANPGVQFEELNTYLKLLNKERPDMVIVRRAVDSGEAHV